MPMHALRRSSLTIALAVGLFAGSARPTFASGVAPGKATPVQREQAQSRFIKGRDLYNAKNYDAALVELSASLDIVASPNTRLYVGRCLREMGRLVAAYAELGRSAIEAKELQGEDARYEKAGTAAAEERTKLVPKLAFVEIRVTHASEATKVLVSGEDVRRGGWDEPVPVVPGEASIVVETPGHAPIRKDVHLVAGERAQVAIDAGADGPVEAPAEVAKHEEPTPREPGGRALIRPIAFAAGGIAVAGLVTFVVAGALANGTYSDLEKACGSGPCPPGHDGDISAGKTQQTVANIGLGVFAIAGAASVTLFVLGRPKKDAPVAASARVTAGPTFLGMQGAF